MANRHDTMIVDNGCSAFSGGEKQVFIYYWCEPYEQEVPYVNIIVCWKNFRHRWMQPPVASKAFHGHTIITVAIK